MRKSTEILKQKIEDGELGYCSIVGVTAYVSTEAVQKCYSSGMDEVGNIQN